MVDPLQLASLPVAVALITLITNILTKSGKLPATGVALVCSLIYSLAVFVWPLPPVPTENVLQVYGTRWVVAILSAFLVTGSASDISGRVAVSQEKSFRTHGKVEKPKLMKKWY